MDVSDEDWQVQAETVDKVIAQLGAQDIPRLMVYNKADKCDPDVIPFFRPDEGVKISAKTGEGVDALLAAIEKAHEERYRRLLTNVENDLVFSKDGDVIWECANCGHIVVGKKAPEICPVCAHPQSYFMVKAENY